MDSEIKIKRSQYIEQLSEELTLAEASSLLAKIHAKKSEVTKSKRFGLYPIHDWPSFIRMKQLEASHWSANEVEFTKDLNDFNEFTEEEQKPLLMAFGFFAVGDGTITSMLAYRLLTMAPTLEKQLFYIVQLNNERVHAETYANMIYTLVPDERKRMEIFEAVEKINSIKNMNLLIEEALECPDGERDMYFTLACTEYLMFMPLFCIIFWYRAYRKGKISKIILSNELIGRDEATHGINGTENYKALPAHLKYTNQEAWDKIDRFVEVSSGFGYEALENIHLNELTPENVKKYIQYVADDQLERMGHSKCYHVESPFVWMDFTKLVPKTNFYEGTVAEYSRFDVTKGIEEAMNFSGINEKKENSSIKPQRKNRF